MNRPPRFHGFISERNELLRNICWLIFSIEKNKSIKHSEKFVSSIKNLRANVLFNVLSVFQINVHVFQV